MRRRYLRGVGSLVAPATFVAGCLSQTATAPPTPDAGVPVPVGGDGGPEQTGGSVDGAAPPDTAPSAVPDAPPSPPATDLANQPPIAFGDVDCGTTPTPQLIVFSNTGGSPLTYSAQLAGGTAFSIMGTASGTIAPGQSGTLTIAPEQVVGAVAGTTLTDTLQVTTNDPASTSPIGIAVSMTPQGGSLQISPAPVDFGQAFLHVQAPPQAVTIKNVGTKYVSLGLLTPTDSEFSATWAGAPATAPVIPGKSLAGATIDFTPTSTGTKTATVALLIQGPLCAPAAPTVTLTGVGTSTPIAISPGSIDFTTTSCGATSPLAPTVTLTNASGTAVTYSSALKSGVAYTLTNASGTVPANGNATITVNAKPVPAAAASLAANALDDTLTVTTGAGGGGAGATIGITQAASGAVLAVSMPNTAFGQVVANTPGVLPYSVTNSGNATATVSAATTGTGFTATNPGSTTVPADSAAHLGSVMFTTVPPYGGASGTFTLSTTTPLCQATPPAAIGLTATKVGPVASFAATPLAYAPRCGQPAPAAQSVTITNTGTTQLALSNVVASAGFTVTAYTATIAPSKAGTITVAAAAPSGEKGGQVRSGTVSFTTNEYATPTHSVSLAATIQGANLGYYSDAGGKTAISQETTVCCGTGTSACEPWWACSYTGLTYYIYNSGNEAVTLGTAVVTDPTGFQTSALTSSTIGPGQSQGSSPYGPDYTAAPSPPACGPKGFTTRVETIQYAVTAGDVCVALPALTYNALGTPCP